MYVHVVIFKLEDKSDLDKAVGLFRSMEGNIPVLRELTVGTDDVHSDYSGDLCIVCKFDKAEHVDEYFHHPFHQNILEQTKGMFASKLKADFWE